MGARVTLNGIKRVGFENWKGRAIWSRMRVRIWSAEHAAWWRPDAAGYTDDEKQAGVWDFLEAYADTKHCGPEKRIAYYAALTANTTPSQGRAEREWPKSSSFA